MSNKRNGGLQLEIVLLVQIWYTNLKNKQQNSLGKKNENVAFNFMFFSRTMIAVKPLHIYVSIPLQFPHIWYDLSYRYVQFQAQEGHQGWGPSAMSRWKEELLK